MKFTSVIRVVGISTLGLAASVSALSLAFLPEQVSVTRSALVNASPNQVFAQLNSTQGFHQMNPFLDAHPNLKISRSGPESGVGAVYAWDDNGSGGSQTIVAVETDRQIKMQLDLGAQGRPTSTFSIQPEVNGTRVSWTMQANFGWNPIGRIIGQSLDGQLGPMYEQGLNKLNRTVSVAAAK
jgi:hypothetical protein